MLVESLIEPSKDDDEVLVASTASVEEVDGKVVAVVSKALAEEEAAMLDSDFGGTAALKAFGAAA